MGGFGLLGRLSAKCVTMLHMPLTYDDDNLAKHKVSRDEVDEVLDGSMTAQSELAASDRGNQRVMLIGFTLHGRLLEVGIEFFANRDHVFHANDATEKYRQEFERSIRP